MRKLYPAAFLLITAPAFSQCPFVPTVSPDYTILYCVDDSVVLSTQTYDAYQWLMNGEPIPGATERELTVYDAGAYYSVIATLDACTDTSDAALVDGWLGLLPYLISGGDEPYAIINGGIAQYCEGDTLLLSLGGPYQIVSWTDFGEVIPGQTDDTLKVTTSGSYSAIVALGFCPDQISGVGVDVGVQFSPISQPTIIASGGLLCPQPSIGDVQWYLDGSPFATTTCIDPSTPGQYTVEVDNGQPCREISEPYIATGVSEAAAPVFRMWPIPARDILTISWPAGTDLSTGWRLLDLTGRVVRTGGAVRGGRLELDVRALAPGRYFFVPVNAALRPVAVELAR